MNEDLHSYSISGSGYGLDNFAIQALERHPLISYSTSTILKSIDKEFDLKGKNILITGGSRGLGSVLVKACLLKGANVLTTYKTSEDSIKAIKKEVGENGSHLVALRVDLIDKISVKHLNVWLKDQSIKLDYLICNAAPSIGQSRFDENQSFEFLKTFEAFYKIGLYSLKGSIEHFNEGCSILNISTDYINSPVTGFSHYISAKSAMESLFKGLNIEYPDYHFKSIRLPKMRTDQTNLGLDTSELPIPSEFLNKIFKTLTFN